jgi:hypothetical protein
MSEGLTIRRIDRHTRHDSDHEPPIESVEYLIADRKRSERRGWSGYRLRANGRTMFRAAPRTALITRCDVKQTFHVNFDDRQCVVSPLNPLNSRPTRAQVLALAASGQFVARAQREPTVLVEIETIDTGERKEMFSHTARHVMTTRRVLPLSGADRVDTTVTDGWYIDLDTDISCEPSWRSGHAFASLHQAGEQAPVPMFKDIGKPESGFPVATKRTSSGTMTLSDGSTRPWGSVWETEVTELSISTIDPALFEIPSGFRLVERIRQEPVAPLVIRLKRVYDRIVHRRPRA